MKFIINIFFIIYFLIFLDGLLVNLADPIKSDDEEIDGDCNQNLFVNKFEFLNAI